MEMYKNFTFKQVLLYTWENIPEIRNKYKRAVFNGAIRTGKTEIGSKGWMRNRLKQSYETRENKMKGWNEYFIVGSSKDAIMDNVVQPLLDNLEMRGYNQCDRFRDLGKTKHKRFFINHNTKWIYVKYKGIIIKFKFFGADNKRAFKFIQGRTFRGGFVDEAGLIDIKFLETAEGRCASWDDAIIIFTSNPEGDENHEFFVKYIRGGEHKKTFVLTLTLLDNPNFTQEHVEYYRSIFTPSMFLQKIMGRWVHGVGGCYPKLSMSHLMTYNEFIELYKHKIHEITIGCDYGESDAVASVATAFTRNYEKVIYFDEYYHKNSEISNKDIYDYVKDNVEFFHSVYQRFFKIVTVYVDSANLSYFKLLKKEVQRRGWGAWCRVRLVNKASVYGAKGEGSAIQERIDFENLMLGTNTSVYVKDKVQYLLKATKTAVYKNGQRQDDKSTMIDPLDAKEYSTKHRLKHITNLLMRRGNLHL
jgi:PBSX family phage terminase large subunit